MKHKKITGFMLEQGGQWVQWKSNAPTATNMRGVCWWQITSARSIMVILLKIHGTSLNDQSLETLLAEVKSIFTTRPITSKSLSDFVFQFQSVHCNY